jgi:hypothetical protein
MADVKSVLLTLQVDAKGAVTNLDAVKKKLKSTGVDAKALAADLKNTKAAAEGLGGAAGIAGAALTEVGRTISDMPYGLGAITNNISQLGNMFALLVSSAGGLGKALTALKTVFMGPVGILVAFQAAVAGLEAFRQKQERAKKASENFSTELMLTSKIVQEYSDILLDGDRQLEDRAAALDVLGVKYADLRRAIEEGNYSQHEQIALGSKYVEQAAKIKKTQDEILDTQKHLSKQYLTTNEAEEQIQKNEAKIIELREQLKTTTGSYTGQEGMAYESSMNSQIQSLKSQNLELNENIRILGKMTHSITALTMQEEELDNILKEGTFSIQLRGDALKELRKNEERQQDFAQKTAELTAKTEEERIEIQRKAALAEAEGIGAAQARYEINKYYDALITQERKKQAEERKKISEDEADAQFKAFLKQQDEIFKSALQGVKDEQKLIPMRKQLEYAQRALKAETEEERKAVLEDSLNYQKNYFQSLSESEAFTEEERINFKMKSFQAIEQLRRLEEEREIARHEAELERINKQAETFAKISDGLETVAELFQASSDRELTIAKNATTAKNNELRKELDNRNLTAAQREKINQRIAKNEQKLAIEEDKIKEKAFKRQKAFQIAIALADTAGSALKAYASQLLPGDPTSVIRAQVAAGIATAFGLIQVATIAKQKYERGAIPSISSGSGGSAPDAGGGAPSFNVVGASELNQVAAAVAGQEKEPVRAYVVASDVSTAQEMDRNILSEASIG